MSLTIIFVTVTLIILFILTQKIDFIITKGEVLTFTIDLTLFSLVLTEERQKKEKKKKQRSLKPPLGAIYKSARYLLSRSSVVVRHMRLATTELLAERRITLPLFIALTSALAVIKSTAGSFVYADNRYLISDVGDSTPDIPYLDLVISFSPLSLIISAFIFLYYLVKPRLKKIKFKR